MQRLRPNGGHGRCWATELLLHHGGRRFTLHPRALLFPVRCSSSHNLVRRPGPRAASEICCKGSSPRDSLLLALLGPPTVCASRCACVCVWTLPFRPSGSPSPHDLRCERRQLHRLPARERCATAGLQQSPPRPSPRHPPAATSQHRVLCSHRRLYRPLHRTRISNPTLCNKIIHTPQAKTHGPTVPIDTFRANAGPLNVQVRLSPCACRHSVHQSMLLLRLQPRELPLDCRSLTVTRPLLHLPVTWRPFILNTPFGPQRPQSIPTGPWPTSTLAVPSFACFHRRPQLHTLTTCFATT